MSTCYYSLIYVHTYFITHVAPKPMIFLQPNYLQQGIIGDTHALTCLIALSSKVQLSLVNLTWNFTSNDDRVTVIPTTITTDDSIGIIYTTVIHFDYLMEGDKEYYACTLIIDGDLSQSIFNLEITSKIFNIHTYVRICIAFTYVHKTCN